MNNLTKTLLALGVTASLALSGCDSFERQKTFENACGVKETMKEYKLNKGNLKLYSPGVSQPIETYNNVKVFRWTNLFQQSKEICFVTEDGKAHLWSGTYSVDY